MALFLVLEAETSPSVLSPRGDRDEGLIDLGEVFDLTEWRHAGFRASRIPESLGSVFQAISELLTNLVQLVSKQIIGGHRDQYGFRIGPVIVVVGAGFAGVEAAWALASRGHPVCL